MNMQENQLAAAECPKATELLERRLVEEPLTKQEDQFLADHLANCAHCAAFQTLTSGMLEFSSAIPPNEVKQGFAAVLHKQNHPPAHTPKRIAPKRVAISFALAAVLVGAIAVTLYFSSATPTPLPQSFADCAPSPVVQITPGIQMTYCGTTAPAYTAAPSSVPEITLNQGTIAAAVSPGIRAKTKLRIITPNGIVEVKGTIFSVHVDADLTFVDVMRGVVQIRAAESAPPQYVRAGGRGTLSDEILIASPARITDRLFAALTLNPNGNPNENQTEKIQAVAEAAADAKATSGKTAAPTVVAAAEELAEAERAPNESAASIMSLEQYTQQARTCLIAHKWQCAAKNYRGIIQYYPKQPDAQSALVSLAQIELNHLNTPQRALSHFQQYLRKSASGPLAPEAIFGMASANRKLGNTKEEMRLLQRFSEKFPRSPYRTQVSKRLSELNAQ